MQISSVTFVSAVLLTSVILGILVASGGGGISITRVSFHAIHITSIVSSILFIARQYYAANATVTNVPSGDTAYDAYMGDVSESLDSRNARMEVLRSKYADDVGEVRWQLTSDGWRRLSEVNDRHDKRLHTRFVGDVKEELSRRTLSMEQASH